MLCWEVSLPYIGQREWCNCCQSTWVAQYEFRVLPAHLQLAERALEPFKRRQVNTVCRCRIEIHESTIQCLLCREIGNQLECPILKNATNDTVFDAGEILSKTMTLHFMTCD